MEMSKWFLPAVAHISDRVRPDAAGQGFDSARTNLLYFEHVFFAKTKFLGGRKK